jgi:quercetin dioxygenase-like cupin family protein
MNRLFIRIGVFGVILLTSRPGIPEQSQGKAHSRIAFSHTLPNLNGESLKAHLVEVSYLPGESSASHTHPCPVIGYVLQGAVRMQVKGEPEAVYKPGESFYEAPNGLHQLSANASKTEPAKFLAYFVCDHDTPLSLPMPTNESSAGSRK